jgi:hypothetical protein
LQTRQRLKQATESQGPRLSASETRRAFSGGSDGALSRRLNETRCNSFTAGTLVETEAGLAPIEEIDLGDNVLAEDPDTGEQGYFEVVALTNHPTDEILKVTIEAESQEAETLDSTADSGDNDSTQLNSQTDDDAPSKIQNLKSEMEVTPDHPVYIEGKGWLNAENLSIGDRLRRADGGYARVLAIERIELAEPEPVYNFTVKGSHTYFVLEVGVLVHNCGPEVTGPATDVDARLDNLDQFTAGSKASAGFAGSPETGALSRRLEEKNRTAYLIGGAMTPEIDVAIENTKAFKQIVELAENENYHKVIVVDVFGAGLESTKLHFERLRPDLMGKVEFLVEDGTKLPKLHNTDIFIVAPNPGGGLRLPRPGLLPSVPKIAENSLGLNSKIYVATDVDTIDNMIKNLEKRFEITRETFGRYGGIRVGPDNILIDSVFFEDKKVNRLVTIHRHFPLLPEDFAK